MEEGKALEEVLNKMQAVMDAAKKAGQLIRGELPPPEEEAEIKPSAGEGEGGAP